MNEKKTQKTVLLVIAIALYAAASVWLSIIGFYARDLPWIGILLGGAITCSIISAKIKKNDKVKAPDARIKCVCGAFNQRNAETCWSCGKKLQASAYTALTRDATPATWTCACGETNAQGDLFCSQCGNRKPAPGPSVAVTFGELTTWMCMCGKINGKDAGFCTNCGERRTERKL